MADAVTLNRDVSGGPPWRALWRSAYRAGGPPVCGGRHSPPLDRLAAFSPRSAPELLLRYCACLAKKGLDCLIPCNSQCPRTLDRSSPGLRADWTKGAAVRTPGL